MRNKLYQWLVLSAIIALASCYPKGAEFAEDLDLVYTNHDQGFDYKTRHTYALPDSVIKITGDIFSDPDGNHKPEFASPVYAAAITTAIKTNMGNLGWTLVDKNANPDVILLPSTITTTNIYYYYDWWYWGWYYPGFYPGWGWYYPGYYPPYVTGYRSGSVFVQMTDNKPAPGNGTNVTVLWTAILNGLAEGNSSSITARITTGINQAFAQSPYLKIN
jgi:uncharacterized protein DUF4136